MAYRNWLGYNHKSMNFQIMHNMLLLFFIFAGVFMFVVYWFSKNLLVYSLPGNLKEEIASIYDSRLDTSVQSISATQEHFIQIASERVMQVAQLHERLR